MVVTGATSGIGIAFARRFAGQGADMVICGRREALLEERATELTGLGASRVAIVCGDLADEATVARLLDEVRLRPPSVLVNNAGFGHSADVAGAELGRLQAMLRVQAEVPLRLAHAALPAMVAAREGLIVNVGSLAGRVAVPGSALYVSTKVFLERFSETLALEASPHGVVVQALTPGYVRTDFHRDVEDLAALRRNRGLVRWMDADSVVDQSMRAAARAERRLERSPGAVPRSRDVVVVPGTANRFLAFLAGLLPRTLAYRAALSRAPR